MSDKPLDAAGTTGPMGKHDFVKWVEEKRPTTYRLENLPDPFTAHPNVTLVKDDLARWRNDFMILLQFAATMTKTTPAELCILDLARSAYREKEVEEVLRGLLDWFVYPGAAAPWDRIAAQYKGETGQERPGNIPATQEQVDAHREWFVRKQSEIVSRAHALLGKGRDDA